MVDLCLHQTSRSLGSTIELHRKFVNLCQVSLFPCVLVYDYNDCAYAVCQEALEQSCPQYYLFPTCFAFSLPD